MRLWAFLVLLGVSQSLARSNRTKRQFEADHCDPAYCQIPVGSYGHMETRAVNALVITIFEEALTIATSGLQ